MYSIYSLVVWMVTATYILASISITPVFRPGLPTERPMIPVAVYVQERARSGCVLGSGGITVGKKTPLSKTLKKRRTKKYSRLRNGRNIN